MSISTRHLRDEDFKAQTLWQVKYFLSAGTLLSMSKLSIFITPPREEFSIPWDNRSLIFTLFVLTKRLVVIFRFVHVVFVSSSWVSGWCYVACSFHFILDLNVLSVRLSIFHKYFLIYDFT